MFLLPLTHPKSAITVIFAGTGESFCYNRFGFCYYRRLWIFAISTSMTCDPCDSVFCFNQPLFLLELSNIFAGTSDFHGCEYGSIFLHWDRHVIFYTTGEQFCFNQYLFLLEPMCFLEMQSIFLHWDRHVIFYTTGEQFCFNQYLFLLEPMCFLEMQSIFSSLGSPSNFCYNRQEVLLQPASSFAGTSISKAVTTEANDGDSANDGDPASGGGPASFRDDPEDPLRGEGERGWPPCVDLRVDQDANNRVGEGRRTTRMDEDPMA